MFERIFDLCILVSYGERNFHNMHYHMDTPFWRRIVQYCMFQGFGEMQMQYIQSLSRSETAHNRAYLCRNKPFEGLGWLS